jgi:hypothetical protein
MQSFSMTTGFACATGLTVVALLAGANISGRLLPKN